MARKNIFFMLILLLILTSAVWTTASAKKDKVFTEEQVIWEISKAEVINAGETTVTKEGTFLKNYVVQAKAKAKNNNIVPEGTVVFTLSAFKPNRELPGQNPDTWYVQGEWVITKKDATQESADARYSADKAYGKIKTEMVFNPLTEPGNWSSLAWVPMSPTAGRWSKGKGSLTLNGQFEGDLMLELFQLPEVQ